MSDNRPFTPKEQDLQWKKDLEKRIKNDLKPTRSRTVSFNNSMSAATMQTRIDPLHKYIPKGSALTFQFEDGSYSLSSPLTFSGFMGGGTIYIQGDTGEAGHGSRHTNQNVVLDWSGTSGDGIILENCTPKIIIQDINGRVLTSSDNVLFKATNCIDVEVLYNYLRGTVNTLGRLVKGINSNIYINLNYFTNVFTAIFATEKSSFNCVDNDDTSTLPKYGQRANESIIFRSGTFVDGSTADDSTSNGGQVFS